MYDIDTTKILWESNTVILVKCYRLGFIFNFCIPNNIFTFLEEDGERLQ